MQAQFLIQDYFAMQQAAFTVGKKVAEQCLKKGVEKVAFDRGGYLYHGRIKVRVFVPIGFHMYVICSVIVYLLDTISYTCSRMHCILRALVAVKQIKNLSQ